jgi:hypothetical protein
MTWPQVFRLHKAPIVDMPKHVNLRLYALKLFAKSTTTAMMSRMLLSIKNFE